METFWLHCNKCFIRHHPQVKFYVSQCSHVHCHGCALKIKENNFKCLVCNVPNQWFRISEELREEFLLYFRSPAVCFDQGKEVYSFQMSNAKKLLDNLVAKYNGIKKELLKSHNKMKAIQEENAKLKELLKGKKSCEENSTLYYTSTPISGSHSPSMVGSMVSSVRSNKNLLNTPNFDLRRMVLNRPPGMTQRQVTPNQGYRGGSPLAISTPCSAQVVPVQKKNVHMVREGRMMGSKGGNVNVSGFPMKRKQF